MNARTTPHRLVIAALALGLLAAACNNSGPTPTTTTVASPTITESPPSTTQGSAIDPSDVPTVTASAGLDQEVLADRTIVASVQPERGHAPPIG